MGTWQVTLHVGNDDFPHLGLLLLICPQPRDEAPASDVAAVYVRAKQSPILARLSKRVCMFEF